MCLQSSLNVTPLKNHLTNKEQSKQNLKVSVVSTTHCLSEIMIATGFAGRHLRQVEKRANFFKKVSRKVTFSEQIFEELNDNIKLFVNLENVVAFVLFSLLNLASSVSK